jgi:DNA-nicking Smr family endonuclease
LTNNISNKDKADWEDFLSSKERLPNKDLNHKKKKYLKVRSIDLHGYSLDEANRLITKFIIESHIEKVSKLIIVTGKGLHSDNDKDPYISKDLGMLKYSVPEFINNSIELMNKIIEIKDADIKDGGSGAFYIYLKK